MNNNEQESAISEAVLGLLLHRLEKSTNPLVQDNAKNILIRLLGSPSPDLKELVHAVEKTLFSLSEEVHQRAVTMAGTLQYYQILQNGIAEHFPRMNKAVIASIITFMDQNKILHLRDFAKFSEQDLRDRNVSHPFINCLKRILAFENVTLREGDQNLVR